MNWLFKTALELAQVPEKDIADLEKSLPALARLCKAAKQIEPLIHDAMPHIEALKPTAQKAFDIVEAEYPDIEAVLPTLEEFIQFANQKGI